MYLNGVDNEIITFKTSKRSPKKSEKGNMFNFLWVTQVLEFKLSFMNIWRPKHPINRNLSLIVNLIFC